MTSPDVHTIPSSTYRVFKDVYRHPIRWKIERVHTNGKNTPIGEFKTQNRAVTTARLLAGRSGSVNLERSI